LKRLRLPVCCSSILAGFIFLGSSATAQEAAPPAKPYQPVTWKNGLQYQSEDGNVLFRIGGYFQADGDFFVDDSQELATDTFFIRRGRLLLDGSFWKRFDFRFSPDFGQGKMTLYDAYLDLKLSDAFRLRMGKARAPLGLERQQSATNITMVERALPTNLVPVRDLGLQAQGDFANGVLSYAAGVFNGVPDAVNGDTDTDDGKDGAARIFTRPFKNSSAAGLQGLGFGVAGSFGDAAGALPVYKTTGMNTFFQYLATSTADGRHTRLNPMAYYYVGPFGLMGEYVESAQEVRNGTALEDIHNRSYMATASWVVSGEKVSYEGVVPENPMGPAEGGKGALQLALRYNVLRVDELAFPTFANPDVAAERASAWGLGINWYLNYYVRFSFQAEWTQFQGGAPAGADREDEKALLIRLQVRT
jgi:phosphate-selective porin OprO and OprP